jgi:hypothetical protein
MKQKGIARYRMVSGSVAILLIIFIALLAGAGYFVYKNFNLNSTPTEVGTLSNWKTYKDSRYKYSVKYPSGWHISSGDNSLIYLVPNGISTPESESVSISLTQNVVSPQIPSWFINYSSVSAGIYDGSTWAVKNTDNDEIIFWKNQTSVLAHPIYGLGVNPTVYSQILATFQFLN